MADRDGVRLTDADRRRLLERLSAHAGTGALDLDELERRIAALDAAVTRADAAGLFADLGPLPDDGSPADRPPTVRRGRGHGHADQAAPEWRATVERFRDPRSGRVMRVWEDAAGTRHYVPDDDL